MDITKTSVLVLKKESTDFWLLAHLTFEVDKWLFALENTVVKSFSSKMITTSALFVVTCSTMLVCSKRVWMDHYAGNAESNAQNATCMYATNKKIQCIQPNLDHAPMQTFKPQNNERQLERSLDHFWILVEQTQHILIIELPFNWTFFLSKYKM